MVDHRSFVLGTLGVILAIMFAAGEFLGWWDQLGEFGFWASVALAAAGYIMNASRTQANGIRRDIGGLRGDIGGLRSEFEGGPRRLRGDIGGLRAVTEAGFARLDLRARQNHAATIEVLREIRDLLRRNP